MVLQLLRLLLYSVRFALPHCSVAQTVPVTVRRVTTRAYGALVKRLPSSCTLESFVPDDEPNAGRSVRVEYLHAFRAQSRPSVGRSATEPECDVLFVARRWVSQMLDLPPEQHARHT